MHRAVRHLTSLALAACSACVALRATAQPEVNVFAPLGFDEALANSIRDHRLLVVYLRGHAQGAHHMGSLGNVNSGGDAFAEMDARTWKNPTLAAWLRWHATTITVNEKEVPDLFYELGDQYRKFGNTNADPGIFPHVGVYRDGILIAVIPASGYQEDSADIHWTLGELGMVRIQSYRMFPKPVGMLVELDHMLAITGAKDPVWAIDHERANPPPQPPDWTLFHDAGDANAPAFADPARGSDLLARLDQARAAVASGDLHDATGLYTWVWERADALDPVYRPARAAVLAAEFADLASKRPGARDRLRDMRRTIEDRYLWWDGQTWLEYLLINDCLHDSAASTAVVARIVSDVDEDALATREEQAILDLLYSRPSWSGLADPTTEQLTWLNNQVAEFSTPSRLEARLNQAEGQEEDDNFNLRNLRSRLFFDESCRVYAALLKHGRDLDAGIVASRLIALAPRLVQRDDVDQKLYTAAGARRALVATALIAGQSDARHAGWLKAAAAEGQPDPNLSARAQRLKAAR